MSTILQTNALLRPEAVIEAAARIEPDAFDFLDGLEVLCDALDREAACTPEGRQGAHNGLVQSLVTQARVRRQRQRHPEIAAIPVEDPVFVIGFPRTGTTFLHNLLAQHPEFHCPDLWELLTPAGGRDADAERTAIARARAYVDDYYCHAPDMPKVHPMDALRPDECQRLLGNAFRSPIYWIRYDVPSYARWLLGQDMRGAYAFHRIQLQHILWRRSGGRLALKDPFHIWHLDALAAVYPRARFLFLHRDPATSVVSTCALTRVARGGRSARRDPHGIGKFWLEHIEQALARVPEVRRAAIPAGAALDIRYDDLVAAPAETMARICGFLDVPMTDDARRHIRGFIAANPLQAKGVHLYGAEEFGLHPDDLRARFATYRSTYNL
jgi:hypothetical protein